MESEGDSPNVYWRLKGALSTEFQRNFESALERTEIRIIQRIDAAEQAARRAEDSARLTGLEFERRLRLCENGLEQARAQARLLMWLVPIGFGAITLAMGIINFMRGPLREP